MRKNSMDWCEILVLQDKMDFEILAQASFNEQDRDFLNLA